MDRRCFHFAETKLPLQSWALEKCKTVGCGKDVNAFGWPTGEAADQTKDPWIMKCAPLGFPRVMLGTFEVFQANGRVLMRFQQDGSVRDIWMDGRKHPEDAYGLWMGHSTGKWEGDTLVVDTVGIIDTTWLDLSERHTATNCTSSSASGVRVRLRCSWTSRSTTQNFYCADCRQVDS